MVVFWRLRNMAFNDFSYDMVHPMWGNVLLCRVMFGSLQRLMGRRWPYWMLISRWCTYIVYVTRVVWRWFVVIVRKMTPPWKFLSYWKLWIDVDESIPWDNFKWPCCKTSNTISISIGIFSLFYSTQKESRIFVVVKGWRCSSEVWYIWSS